ncbi:MAG: cytochrome c [Candidatus Eremiobacteraeota bacterium]|nr:cytochrome c [Candidatus Eremiobacteraeota bacterium]
MHNAKSTSANLGRTADRGSELTRLHFAAVLVACAMFGCSPAVSEKTSTSAAGSGSQTGDREAGAQVFRANCSACHGTTGVEGGIGPSLRNESSRMDFGATVSWIENPQPPMPKLYPKPLSAQQVRDVTAYVEAL